MVIDRQRRPDGLLMARSRPSPPILYAIQNNLVLSRRRLVIPALQAEPACSLPAFYQSSRKHFKGTGRGAVILKLVIGMNTSFIDLGNFLVRRII